MAAYVDPIFESMDMGPPAGEGMSADGGTSPNTLKGTSADEGTSSDDDDDMSVEEGVSAEGPEVDRSDQERVRHASGIMSTEMNEDGSFSRRYKLTLPISRGRQTGKDERSSQTDLTAGTVIGPPKTLASETTKQETSTSTMGTSESEEDMSKSMKRASSSGNGRPTQKRQVTGTAKKPSNGMLQYDTSKYPLYDPQTKEVGEHIVGAHTSFKQYDNHTLFVLPGVDVEDVPTRGVRLDDNTVALVIGKCSKKALNENWKAEFDMAGMTRGLRVPLGHAAKVFKNVGDKDLEGHILSEGEEGYYYLWHKGLHLLCGKEGLDGGIYKKRPAFEEPICAGLGWKKSARALIQLPAGHPNDSTMNNIKGYDKLMRAAGKWGGSPTAKAEQGSLVEGGTENLLPLNSPAEQLASPGFISPHPLVTFAQVPYAL